MTGKTKKTVIVVSLTSLIAVWVISMSYIQINSSLTAKLSFKLLENIYRIKGPLSGTDAWVLKFVNQTYIFPPSTEPYNFSKVHDTSYSVYAHGDSWWYLNRYIRHLFTDEPPGFFLEAGALDGEFLSNTLWLEKTLGWTGLLIEPDKDSFRLLLKKHRKAWTSNACISKDGYPMEVVFVNLEVRGKSHEVRYGRMNFPANSHLYGTNIFTDNITSHVPATEHYSLVQCFPLITFVRALGIEKIDLLSLDLQGNEKVILRNFPWSSIKVRVVIIEDQIKTVDHDFIQFMEKCNYKLMNEDDLPESQDHIYVNKDETILLEKIKKLKKENTKKL
ncbi:protein Star-like [Palaemon carinicauda]|uniref:protein Star-like n=1 Tax=Palaemon carinicauda TaxID=392227 RepID=UPI0035B65144